MTKENRLKRAKVLYASGDRDHDYVKEFLEELEAPVEEEPKKKEKRKSQK